MAIQPVIEDWDEVDHLWATHTDVRPAVAALSSSIVLYETRPNWGDVDIETWWRTGVESRRGEAKKLYETLQRSKRIWQRSASRFDDDPLATDWSSDRYRTGPLQIRQEENWSQWLASLIRSGPPQFLHSAFGFQPEGETIVEREAHLTKFSGKDRYVDILVFGSNRGVSIEVKRNDTHYKKTLKTTSLIERQHNREWAHFLLLPESQMPALRDAFPERLEEPSDGRSVIHAEDSNDVIILYWRHISEALRTALLDSEPHGTHWEASAYIFCTLIEQKIASFLPEPVLEAVLSDQDLIAGNLSTGLTDHDIEGQTSYLQQAMMTQPDE